MKHTTRKKMLLSSIAMLLVALVALGSATFAWFTQNTQVTASGFKGKVSSAVGLKILSESEGATDDNRNVLDVTTYKTSTTLATGLTNSVVLSPVSIVPGASNFSAFETKATSEKNGARPLTEKVTAVTPIPSAYDDGGKFYVEKVYVALSGTTENTIKHFKFTNITANWTNDNIAKAGRVIVQYHDASGNDSLVGKFASTAVNTDEIKAAIDANTAITTEGQDANAETVSWTATAGNNTQYTVKNTQGCYFTVAVFLDGQDGDCKTSQIVANDIIDSISFTLDLTD